MERLNLGCGNRPMAGWTNVDFYHSEADEKVDLLSFPWPWADNSIDSIAMFHFLEHVKELEQTIEETYRVLKPDGLLWIKVPHGRGFTACMIGHRHFFTWWTFKMLVSKSWYQWSRPQLFRQESYRARMIKGVITWTPLDWFASRFPRIWEQFIPIPPTEIEWKGRALKDDAS